MTKARSQITWKNMGFLLSGVRMTGEPLKKEKDKIDSSYYIPEQTPYDSEI